MTQTVENKNASTQNGASKRTRKTVTQASAAVPDDDQSTGQTSASQAASAPLAKRRKHILDNVLLFQVEFHCTSGRKKLHEDDLLEIANKSIKDRLHLGHEQVLTEGDLPDADFASLGNNKMFDLNNLKVFENLKKRTKSFLEQHGVRFLSGYAISLPKAKMVADQLKEIGEEWDAAKLSFLNVYDSLVDDWKKSRPKWANVIEKKKTDRDRIASSIDFAWSAIQVTEFKGKAAAILNANTNLEIDNLSDRLFKTIACDAQDFYQKYLIGRDSVTQKCKNPLVGFREKLIDLSFLDSNAEPITRFLEYVNNVIPSAGKIRGKSLELLSQSLLLLADPVRLRAEGAAIAAGTLTIENLAANLIGVQVGEIDSAEALQKEVQKSLFTKEPIEADDSDSQAAPEKPEPSVQAEVARVPTTFVPQPCFF